MLLPQPMRQARYVRARWIRGISRSVSRCMNNRTARTAAFMPRHARAHASQPAERDGEVAPRSAARE